MEAQEKACTNSCRCSVPEERGSGPSCRGPVGGPAPWPPVPFLSVSSESAGAPVALVPPPPFSFRTYNLIHPIYLLLISPELLRPALSTCAEAQPSRNCSFLCSSAASCRMHTHPQGPRPALSLWHVHSTCAWGNRGKGRGTCSM